MFFAAFQVACSSHAESRGKSGAGVARAKRIVFALATVKETARAAGLAEFAEGFSIAPGEEFVDVTLVGDVEYELVLWRVENTMKSDGELNDSEIGADMTSRSRGHRDDLIAYFLREGRQLLSG